MRLMLVSRTTNHLQVHYTFSTNSGDIVYDSSGYQRDGAIEAIGDANAVWDSNGHIGSCVAFDGNSSISLPEEIFGDISDAITVSMWINIDSEVISSAKFKAGPSDPNLWDKVSWNPGYVYESNDVWMHYGFVKEAGSGIMRIYHDGLLVAQSQGNTKAINGANAGESYMGAGNGSSGEPFIGRIDDFEIYDYAMSQSEILYLAKGQSSRVTQPIKPVFTPVDPYDDGVINLRDFSMIANKWLLD